MAHASVNEKNITALTADIKNIVIELSHMQETIKRLENIVLTGNGSIANMQQQMHHLHAKLHGTGATSGD